jgi:hypothetical protein
MANYFGISKADLIERKTEESTLTSRDSKQRETILQNTQEALTSQEKLMFDGKPATPEAIDSILNAMEIGMEMTKKKNKALDV